MNCDSEAGITEVKPVTVSSRSVHRSCGSGGGWGMGWGVERAGGGKWGTVVGM